MKLESHPNQGKSLGTQKLFWALMILNTQKRVMSEVKYHSLQRKCRKKKSHQEEEMDPFGNRPVTTFNLETWIPGSSGAHEGTCNGDTYKQKRLESINIRHPPPWLPYFLSMKCFHFEKFSVSKFPSTSDFKSIHKLKPVLSTKSRKSSVKIYCQNA